MPQDERRRLQYPSSGISWYDDRLKPEPARKAPVFTSTTLWRTEAKGYGEAIQLNKRELFYSADDFKFNPYSSVLQLMAPIFSRDIQTARSISQDPLRGLTLRPRVEASATPAGQDLFRTAMLFRELGYFTHALFPDSKEQKPPFTPESWDEDKRHRAELMYFRMKEFYMDLYRKAAIFAHESDAAKRYADKKKWANHHYRLIAKPTDTIPGEHTFLAFMREGFHNWLKINDLG